jgi:tetraacyldisaccharide 4'-kinase
VESLGAIIAASRAFGDHQHLSDDEVDEILDVATAEGLEIVTTSKDFVRLVGGHGRAEELSRRCRVIEVNMAFADPQAPHLIIERAIAACRERRLKSNSGA